MANLDQLITAVETGRTNEELDRRDSSVARIGNQILTTRHDGWTVETFVSTELAEEKFADYVRLAR